VASDGSGSAFGGPDAPDDWGGESAAGALSSSANQGYGGGEPPRENWDAMVRFGMRPVVLWGEAEVFDWFASCRLNHMIDAFCPRDDAAVLDGPQLLEWQLEQPDALPFDGVDDTALREALDALVEERVPYGAAAALEWEVETREAFEAALARANAAQIIQCELRKYWASRREVILSSAAPTQRSVGALVSAPLAQQFLELGALVEQLGSFWDETDSVCVAHCGRGFGLLCLALHLRRRRLRLERERGNRGQGSGSKVEGPESDAVKLAVDSTTAGKLRSSSAGRGHGQPSLTASASMKGDQDSWTALTGLEDEAHLARGARAALLSLQNMLRDEEDEPEVTQAVVAQGAQEAGGLSVEETVTRARADAVVVELSRWASHERAARLSALLAACEAQPRRARHAGTQRVLVLGPVAVDAAATCWERTSCLRPGGGSCVATLLSRRTSRPRQPPRRHGLSRHET